MQWDVLAGEKCARDPWIEEDELRCTYNDSTHY